MKEKIEAAILKSGYVAGELVSFLAQEIINELQKDPEIVSLHEYFETNWNREPHPVIDHMLRIDKREDGSFHFYIHPSHTSGVTSDFVVVNGQKNGSCDGR